MKRSKRIALQKRELKQYKKRSSYNMKIFISIAVAVFLFFGVLIVFNRSSQKTNAVQVSNASQENNVTIVDGKQIIKINTKGGYYPKKSIAKAGIPTVLKFETTGTFDCSAAVRIPSLNYSKNLPATGVTEVDLGTQKPNVLSGICAMGMYSFEIDFQS